MKKTLPAFCYLLFILIISSAGKAQTLLDFESASTSIFVDQPDASHLTATFSGYDFTLYSTTSGGVYYGIDRDNPSIFPQWIGYNSNYLYLATDDEEVMTETDITRSGGGLFNFFKVDIASYPSDIPYELPFNVYIQGFRAGSAVTDKVALSTVVKSAGGYAVTAKFDVSSDPKFQGIDKLAITSGYPSDYVAIDNVLVEDVNVTPVKIKKFWGELNGQIAFLHWQSGVESNFNHYELQRSQDAQHFQTIQTVIPKGSDKQYSQNITQLAAITYYRLKAVDNDGKVDFSDLLALSTKEHTAKIKVYPNPTADKLHITLQAPSWVSIFDAQGRLVLKRTLIKGDNEIDLTGLSKGVYYADINGQKTQLIKK